MIVVATIVSVLIIHLLYRYPEAISDAFKNQEITAIDAPPTQTYRNTERGKIEMSQSTATLIGIGMNPKTFVTFHPAVEDLSRGFKETRIIFATEENVNNAALKKLRDWVSLSPHNRSVLVSESVGETVGPKLPREGRIARVRNAALAEYRSGVSSATNY